jgi:glutamyl-tRNA synthetase
MTNPAETRAGLLRTTRLAPSPTGTLHLGNARTFLINWAMARNLGWRIVLRIEDLDLTRVRSGAAEQAIDLLQWLGLDWDEGPLWQSHDLEPYRHAMNTLALRKMVFACARTRKDIERAASAPNLGEGETRFPPELRPPDSSEHRDAWRFDRADSNYRFVVPDERITIGDHLAGASTHDPFSKCGDFIVWTRLGVPAYQLAVVVDDARQGVTDVVRGDDLLPSAARQTLLYRALSFAPPQWWHLPLVLGDDGRRLAKRHGDTHLQAFRSAGVPPERIIGLLAAWSGVGQREHPQPMSAHDFRARFDLKTLSPQAVRFARDDHAWLVRRGVH